jgi:hypothetical protein
MLQYDPINALKKVFYFLDVDTRFTPENLGERYNVSKTRDQIDPDKLRLTRDVHRVVMENLKPDIEELEEFAQSSFDEWDFSAERWCHES